MNIKIDTKEKFTVITPEEKLISANMSEELVAVLTAFLQKDIPHVILCLKSVESIDQISADKLLSIQNQFYENNASFVICEVNRNNTSLFDNSCNITPTVSEAMDIVQMEEIERELFNDFNQ